MKHCELCQQQGDVITEAADWRVVLVNDAHYPGFCRVIWNHHVKEMTDLSATQRNTLMGRGLAGGGGNPQRNAAT